MQTLAPFTELHSGRQRGQSAADRQRWVHASAPQQVRSAHRGAPPLATHARPPQVLGSTQLGAVGVAGLAPAWGAVALGPVDALDGAVDAVDAADPAEPADPACPCRPDRRLPSALGEEIAPAEAVAAALPCGLEDRSAPWPPHAATSASEISANRPLSESDTKTSTCVGGCQHSLHRRNPRRADAPLGGSGAGCNEWLGGAGRSR